MTDKALARQELVREWVQQQFSAYGALAYHDSSMNTRGGITLARIYMLGGLALSRAFGDPLSHIFDDDAAWYIVEREMKIHSGVFYHHIELSQWLSLSMQTQFYKSKFIRGSVIDAIHPELMSAFPTFPASDLVVGSTDSIQPQDAIFHWIGFIGGKSTEEFDGILGLSNDTSLESLTIFVGNTEYVMDFSTRLEDGTFIVRHYVGSGMIRVEGITTNLFAILEQGDPVEFLDRRGHVTYNWKVIAEDSTEENYRARIVDF